VREFVDFHPDVEHLVENRSPFMVFLGRKQQKRPYVLLGKKVREVVLVFQ